MPRLSRLVVPGYPHHITQRGVRSMDIFADDQDRLSYLQFMAEESNRFGVTFLQDRGTPYLIVQQNKTLSTEVTLFKMASVFICMQCTLGGESWHVLRASLRLASRITSRNAGIVDNLLSFKNPIISFIMTSLLNGARIMECKSGHTA